MATLEIDVNCMCLLLDDPSDGALHILMPATRHHPQHQHAVRMLHRSFGQGENGRRSIEGWSLVLRGQPVLNPAPPRHREGEIVNLTDLTGRHVPRALVESGEEHANERREKLAARITLYGAELLEIRAQPHPWLLGTRRVVMAHQASWRLRKVGERLEWHPINARGTEPVTALADLEPDEPARRDEEEVVRVSVHHAVEWAIPSARPAGPPPTPPRTLAPADILHHFGMFYEMLDLDPALHPLPRPDDENKRFDWGTHACKLAGGRLAPA